MLPIRNMQSPVQSKSFPPSKEDFSRQDNTYEDLSKFLYTALPLIKDEGLQDKISKIHTISLSFKRENSQSERSSKIKEEITSIKYLDLQQSFLSVIQDVNEKTFELLESLFKEYNTPKSFKNSFSIIRTANKIRTLNNLKDLDKNSFSKVTGDCEFLIQENFFEVVFEKKELIPMILENFLNLKREDAFENFLLKIIQNVPYEKMLTLKWNPKVLDEVLKKLAILDPSKEPTPIRLSLFPKKSIALLTLPIAPKPSILNQSPEKNLSLLTTKLISQDLNKSNFDQIPNEIFINNIMPFLSCNDTFNLILKTTSSLRLRYQNIFLNKLEEFLKNSNLCLEYESLKKSNAIIDFIPQCKLTQNESDFKISKEKLMTNIIHLNKITLSFLESIDQRTRVYLNGQLHAFPELSFIKNTLFTMNIVDEINSSMAPDRYNYFNIKKDPIDKIIENEKEFAELVNDFIYLVQENYSDKIEDRIRLFNLILTKLFTSNSKVFETFIEKTIHKIDPSIFSSIFSFESSYLEKVRSVITEKTTKLSQKRKKEQLDSIDIILLFNKNCHREAFEIIKKMENSLFKEEMLKNLCIQPLVAVDVRELVRQIQESNTKTQYELLKRVALTLNLTCDEFTSNMNAKEIELQQQGLSKEALNIDESYLQLRKNKNYVFNQITELLSEIAKNSSKDKELVYHFVDLVLYFMDSSNKEIQSDTLTDIVSIIKSVSNGEELFEKVIASLLDNKKIDEATFIVIGSPKFLKKPGYEMIRKEILKSYPKGIKSLNLGEIPELSTFYNKHLKGSLFKDLLKITYKEVTQSSAYSDW